MSVLIYIETQRVIICSALSDPNHLPAVDKIEADVVDTTKKEDVLMSYDRTTEKSTLFESEAKAFFYVRAPGVYHENHRGRFSSIYLLQMA